MLAGGTMVINLDIREMVSGKWEDSNKNDLAGKTLRQICEEYSGRECVAKIRLAGNDRYLCGTETLKRAMLTKGKAMTFSEAIELLGKAAPTILDVIVNQRIE